MHKTTSLIAITAAVALTSAAAIAQAGTYVPLTPSTSCAGSSNRAPVLAGTTQPFIGGAFLAMAANLPGNPADAAFLFTRVGRFGSPAISPVGLGPIGMPGCSLGFTPQTAMLLNKRGTSAAFSFLISGDPALVGLQFQHQILAFDRPFPPLTAPNSLGAITSDVYAGTIGPRELDRSLTEDFSTMDFFDAEVSSARWGSSRLTAGEVGGNGIHGEFDINMLPTNAAGEHVWDTDQPLMIPPTQSLLGRAETILGGRASFTHFEVPAGVGLRFVGSVRPIIRVSGDAVIDGRLSLDGESAPSPASIAVGGRGGEGGAGGGAGGRGADAWLPDTTVAPLPLATPTNVNRGQNGDDLRVLGGSGYAGAVAGTGGEGAPWFPVSGLQVDVSSAVSVFYSAQQIGGGGGGGYLGVGSAGAVTLPLVTPPESPSMAPQGGLSLPMMSAPVGVSSYEHFLVGGSGGGGGGSVATMVRPSIQTSALFRQWTNGHGGGGGGGAIALEVGRNLSVGLGGILSSRGGDSPDSLNNGWTSRGTSPAGGGSGGTVFLRVGGTLDQQGTIDLSGGFAGRHTSQDPSGLNLSESVGGQGSSGRLIAESRSPGQSTGRFASSGSQPSTTRALSERTGESLARSRWYPLPTAFSLAGPFVRGYTITARVDGVRQVFSQGGAFPNPANVPGGPLQFFVQTATLDPMTQLPAAAPGAWTSQVANSSIPLGPNAGLRFLFQFDRSVANTIEILEVQIDYRG